MDILLDFLGSIFFYTVVDLILLPLSLVLATPFILIMGFFGNGTYGKNVSVYYNQIIVFFKRKK